MTNIKPTIAWLGTGLMGNPMVRRLLSAQYTVHVWNRTLAKAMPLKNYDAIIAESAANAVLDADIVFLMLSNAEAIENSLTNVQLKKKILVQMSTIGPGESKVIAKKVVEQGGQYLESPVLGSIPEAENGKLIVFSGGDSEVFTQLKPILSCFGDNPRLVGGLGHASALKLALNQLIASLTVSFSTSLAFVQENDLDINCFMEILRQSALYAPTFDKKLQKMLDHNYQNPNFPTEHLIKDIKLFQKEAKSIDLQFLEVLSAYYGKAQADHVRQDYSCVFEALKKDMES